MLSVRIAGAGAGFLFNVVLARLLGAEQSGAYALALTVSVITSVVARMGMDSAVLKFASAAYATHDTAALHIVERTIHKVVLAPTLILGAIGVIFAPWIAESIFRDPALEAPLRWMAASIPAFSLANLYGELLRAADRHVMSAILQGTAIPAFNLVLIYWLSSYFFNAGGVAQMYLGVTGFVFLIGFLSWKSLLNKEVAHEAVSRITPSIILSAAVPMYASSVSGILMVWVDVLLLGIIEDAQAVGVYNAALRTGVLISFILLAVNSIVAPRLAAVKQDVSEIRTLSRRAALLSAASIVPLFFIFVFFGDKVLGLFGAEFSEGYSALVVVAVGQLINAVTGPVGHILNLCGHQKIEAFMSVLSVVVNVVFCIIFIPLYGFLGAAIANASAVILCNVLRVFAVRRFVGYWVYPAYG